MKNLSSYRILRKKRKENGRKKKMLEDVAWARFYAPKRDAYGRKQEVRGQVVILHGYREGMESLMPLIFALWDKRFNVVVADMPGHGHSNGRRGYLRSVEDAVTMCRALVLYLLSKSVGRKKPTIIIGYSTGALATILFLLKHRLITRAISGCVLLSTPLSVEQNASVYARKLKPTLSVFKTVFGWCRVPAFLMEHSARTVGGGGISGHNPLCYQKRPFFRYAIDMFLRSEYMREEIADWKRMPVPMHVLHGTEDKRACFHTAKNTLGSKENVRFIPLDGVGHYLWGEAPRATIEMTVSAAESYAPFPQRKKWKFF